MGWRNFPKKIEISSLGVPMRSMKATLAHLGRGVFPVGLAIVAGIVSTQHYHVLVRSPLVNIIGGLLAFAILLPLELVVGLVIGGLVFGNLDLARTIWYALPFGPPQMRAALAVLSVLLPVSYVVAKTSDAYIKAQKSINKP